MELSTSFKVLQLGDCMKLQEGARELTSQPHLLLLPVSEYLQNFDR
jgi:hypothetical protein